MKYLVASTFEGGYQPLNAISATTAFLDADIEAQLIDNGVVLGEGFRW